MNQKGQIIVIAILFLVFILLTTLAMFGLTGFFWRNATKGLYKEQALNLAEAGVDKAIWKLNETGGSYPGEENTALGNGTFTADINDISFVIKEIVSTGYVPNAQNPQAKKTVKIRTGLGTSTISFRYAVQVGSGGLDMANSAVVDGNVYSNGNITGSGSSRIEGDAYAVGTISSPDPLVTGERHPNQSSSDMPTIDYQKWKDAANINNDPVTCSPTCTISNDTTIGPKKYIGNLEITNNAIVTMDGPVHVTGNFSMSQGGTTLKLNESFGSNGTSLIVDGTINLTQGGTFQPTSANPKGYILVATTSTDNQAMQISQSGATAVFYALKGGAVLSQTADVSALVAKTLSMSQSSKLTYDFGLGSASFSTGPGGSWELATSTYRLLD